MTNSCPNTFRIPSPDQTHQLFFNLEGYFSTYIRKREYHGIISSQFFQNQKMYNIVLKIKTFLIMVLLTIHNTFQRTLILRERRANIFVVKLVFVLDLFFSKCVYGLIPNSKKIGNTCDLIFWKYKHLFSIGKSINEFKGSGSMTFRQRISFFIGRLENKSWIIIAILKFFKSSLLGIKMILKILITC